MIAYFVHNLDSYSGAAQQALHLAKDIQRNVLVFNNNNKAYNKYTYNDSLEVIDLPRSIFLQFFILFFYSVKYKIKIYHFHGSFNIAMIIGMIIIKNRCNEY